MDKCLIVHSQSISITTIHQCVHLQLFLTQYDNENTTPSFKEKTAKSSIVCLEP